MSDILLLCTLTILEVTKQNLLLCCYAMCTVLSLLIYSVMSSVAICIFTRLHVLSMQVRRDTLSLGLSEVVFLSVTR